MIEQHHDLGQSVAGQANRSLIELRDRCFPALSLDCGEQADAGIRDVDEWRDWTAFETTPDQLRIEDYLDCFDLRGKRILHIGIGNSGLAVRFARRAHEIVGTTVVEAELGHAKSLALGNYRPLLHNKHCPSRDDGLGGGFDFIVDNNPTTFCCCMTHLASMLRFYASVLSPGGQIVTDRVGLGWTTDAPGSNPRWGFSFDDFAECAKLVGLRAYRVDVNVYVLSHGKPPRPAIARRLAHAARALTRKLRRAGRRLRKMIQR